MVTTVSSPVRMSRSRFFKLCWRAPRMRMIPWVMVWWFFNEADHSRESCLRALVRAALHLGQTRMW